MQRLTLKPHYKAVRTYYQEIKQHTQQLSLIHEGNVAPHFANLLRYCAGQMGWTLAEQHAIPRRGRRDLRADSLETVAIVEGLPPMEIIED